jgi:NADH dehydrogenase
MEMKHLKVCGDYGQIAIIPFHARDKDSIREAVEGCDIVVNLMGKNHDTKCGVPWITNWTLEEVHVQAAENVAEVSKEMGVPRFVQMSSIVADVDSPSEWARTKALGELAVKKHYADATIIRPAPIFGPEDKLLVHIANCAKVLPAVPLIDEGGTLLQPVFVHDVAKAIKNIVLDPTTDGKTYELTGPSQYTYKELVEMVYSHCYMKESVVPLPEQVHQAIGYLAEMTPLIAPVLTRDQVELQKLDQVWGGKFPGLLDLNVEPTSVESKAQDILYRFREAGHFAREEGYHVN